MNTKKLRSSVLMIAVTAACPSALADKPGSTQNQQQPANPTAKNDHSAKVKHSGQSNDAMQPKLDSEQVMKLSQQAMTHIAAAEKALGQNKTAAAKSALAKSQQSLAKLYNTPALQAMLNEFDEALNAMSGDKPVLEPLDLAPLAASVASYQAYLDPEVAAGVKQAQERARQGDTQGAEEALRLARNRVAVDVAFLPVEEAYVRVRAAQQALQDNNTQEAKRLLRNVPIVISQVQISRPLVPIRFKLQAAAEAADAHNWARSRALLQQANQAVQRLESVSGSDQVKAEITPIANQVEKLNRQAQAGQEVDADQIRELAKRTRNLGDEQQGMMDKQG